MEKLILIKYGELGTKKGNIKTFINQLKENIKFKLKEETVTITATRNHIIISLQVEQEPIIINKLKEVFGIQKMVIAVKVNSDLKIIKEKALELIKECSFTTFKVATKRVNKSFPNSSMEVNKIMGAYLLKQVPTIKVDVHNPELLLKIEIRKTETYLYYKEIKGLGGYPVGIQGKGLLMLSGGIDSPVAGFLSLKRGLKLDCIYFEAAPHTSINAREKVIQLVAKLKKYDPQIKLYIVPFTKMQETIYKKVDSSYMITIMRRMMYRISAQFLTKIKGYALVNGESIGQVASQTLTSMLVINEVTNLPIIRPLACFDKLEIIALAKKIETYEISILPYPDCCTLFIPRHPIINPCLKRCQELEEQFNYQKLITECLEQVETISNKDLTLKLPSNLL